MGPYKVVSDRAGFFGKRTHWSKMTRNGEKWHKNMVFGLFKKNTSLVLSGIYVNESSYGSLTFWENCMLGKNLVLWFSLLANKISVFFNRQYFTNRLISDFDFWLVDRHE